MNDSPKFPQETAEGPCEVWSPHPGLHVRATDMGDGRFAVEVWQLCNGGHWAYGIIKPPAEQDTREHSFSTKGDARLMGPDPEKGGLDPKVDAGKDGPDAPKSRSRANPFKPRLKRPPLGHRCTPLCFHWY